MTWELVDACRAGDLERVRSLLEERSIRRRILTDPHCLQVAANMGFIEIAKLLLQHGVDPSLNSRGRTAVHFAARRRDSEMLRLLLSHGVVFKTDHMGNTPLEWACMHGSLENVKVIVEYGASPSANPTWYHRTPVLAAASQGHMEIVKYLLEQGADPIGHTDVRLFYDMG